MLLYHGSRRSFKTLKKGQRTDSPDKSRFERIWKRRGPIYLSPSIAFALFFATKPATGMNMMSIRKKIVYFERLDKFDPEKEVYIHVVDISDIPEEKRRWTNEFELEVNMKELQPLKTEIHKAGEIFEHFEIIKDKEEFERRKAAQ